MALNGLKLMWYNLMSYKYRDVVLKSGQVVLGHFYFDVSEKIEIPEYKLLFKKPSEFQEYHDGHLILSFYDIKANKAAEIMNTEKKIATVAEMLDNKPQVKVFIEQHKEYFKDLCDLDDTRDSAGVEFDSLYMPWVSPMEDYKDSADRTIEKINQATNQAGLFGGFKLTPWHLLLGLGVLVLATKFMRLW